MDTDRIDIPALGRSPQRRSRKGTIVHAITSAVRTNASGVLLSAAIALGAFALSRLMPLASPLLIAMILGILLRNLVRLPAIFEPGIQISAKRILRIGIVLLGLQISLLDVAALGVPTIAALTAGVAAGVAATLLVGRWLRVEPQLIVLIAAGFSICGAAAVAAAGSAINATRERLATAIALVSLFGTAMIPLLPALATLLSLTPASAGIWIGGATHEVAQVVVAGGILGSGALTIAVIAKLYRVLLLAPTIIVLGRWFRRFGGSEGTPVTRARFTAVPLFVVGFLIAALIGTLVPMSPVFAGGAALVQQFLLTVAMAALGLGVHRQVLRELSPRVVILATSTTIVVAGVTLIGVLLLAA